MQNFASYREAELDTTRVSTFGALEQIPYLSKRFLLKRYLGLSEEEIAENELMWQEENAAEEETPAMDASAEMRMGGISSAGMGADLGGLDAELPDDAAIDLAGEGDMPDTTTAAPDAGAQAPPTE